MANLGTRHRLEHRFGVGALAWPTRPKRSGRPKVEPPTRAVWHVDEWPDAPAHRSANDGTRKRRSHLFRALRLYAPVVMVALWAFPAQANIAPRNDRPSLTQEDALRWDAAWFPKRIWADMKDVPLELKSLRARDWGAVALYTYCVVAMMLPDGNSLDTRMQLKVNEWWLPRDEATTRILDVSIWGVVSAGWVSQWIYGWVAEQPVRMQLLSLMIEAVAVTQVYHVVLKLLSGRDGPRHGDGRGRTYGPSLRVLKQFPAGTPSGHAATAYAMLAVAANFVEQPWARVGLHLAALAFSTTLVLSNYHFVSDVLLGAAMGFTIGQWVVRHRATKAVVRWYDDVTVVPFVDPWRQGGAVMLFFPSPI